MDRIKQAAIHWLDRRYRIRRFLVWARNKSVPLHEGSIFYYSGGLCAFLFLLQVATGILLLMYYRVGVESSYESAMYITSKVEFGWLVRSLHSWSATFLVFFVLVHMFSVFFMKAFRMPRELTWLTGCVLLGVMMAFGFSGYLLPWDEAAFFATKVGTEILCELPVVGEWLMKLLRGGKDVSGATLSRFFGLHVAILPALAALLMGFHVFFVQVQGMAHSEKAQKTMPFFPNFVLRDVMLWLVILNVLCVLAVFLPWEMGPKADPLLPNPAGIKPPWYFLAQYKLLELMPPRLIFIPGKLWGMALLAGAGLMWLLLPFWEGLLAEKTRDRKLKVLGYAVMTVLIAMTFWGSLS